MQRQRRLNPKQDAQFYVSAGRDKVGFDIKFINAFKGRGIFTTAPFEKGDFLLEYRGELISKQECERRKRLYRDKLKVFMFEFHFDGKLWCVDAAKDDGSFGRLINDNHINPNAKMKCLTLQGKPHLCLFATRDISPGEELTYNYGNSDWPRRSKVESAESSMEEQHAVSSSTSEPSTSACKVPTRRWQKKARATSSYDKGTTENSTTQFISSNEMDPVVCNKKCQKHQLVCTTVSSLDKCIQCVGPGSSSKWLGYKCKVCLGVWHKKCLEGITDDLQHHSQEPQSSKCAVDKLVSDEDNSEVGNLSDDDHSLSDEEYIPDSESQNDDSDTSIPLMSRGREVTEKTVMVDEGTSYGSDADIQVWPSKSKAPPPLEDNIIPNAAKKSHSGTSTKNASKNKPKDEAQLLNHNSRQLTMTIKNYCYICGKPQSKISRHLRVHTTHAEVVHVFSLPEHSKERKTLLEKMRNKGNFRHNIAVLQDGTGPVKVKRKPKSKALAGKFISCMHCQGMYLRKEFWRHARKCPCKPENKDTEKEPGRTRVLGLAAALQTASSHQIPGGVWKLLTAMNQDEVASVVRNDLCIVQFAQSLYNRHGHDATKGEYMRQKLREVGRLLVCLRSEFSIQNLEEAVKPANFQRVVQAVKKVAGFDEEKQQYGTPSLALKLGHTLNKICDIIHCRALMAEDEELAKTTDIFKKLYTSKWSELVSHGALNTPSDAKYNKPSTLPFTEDVQILHQYLEKSAESAFFTLKEMASPYNYAQLAKVTLAQIIVFNRRGAGEVSKMLLKSFNERDNSKLHEDVAMGLSKMEQRLCNYFSRVDIMGKRDRKVAVLLTPSVVNALSLLISKRSECGVCATNVFLFARPKSMSYYRGQDCLRVHASQCGAKHPEHLRSTQLRKHVATLSQVLNLKHNELDQVADFLGHDIRVHRDFYRLPVPTMQLAKISKLLLSMEKGHLSRMQGKSLDEIELEDDIVFSDDEAKDSENESDDGGTSEPASESTVTKPLHDTGGFAETVSMVTSMVNETLCI
ncbi:uncharacterized protein LOC114448636 [Parambassis ranga]|uniref:Uncharacterized protein LOC114448636 n=1 Tax=Parambassis ranga TaxID=210632 RepID=A0A6P7JX70_9TELE|nr:uncharacterized protein LOC114448636 [Parambassis ranga]